VVVVVAAAANFHESCAVHGREPSVISSRNADLEMHQGIYLYLIGEVGSKVTHDKTALPVTLGSVLALGPALPLLYHMLFLLLLSRFLVKSAGSFETLVPICQIIHVITFQTIIYHSLFPIMC
jgi:hypothetical protein